MAWIAFGLSALPGLALVYAMCFGTPNSLLQKRGKSWF